MKAGLIGLGAMGRNHARVIQLTEGIDLVGVYDPAVADARVDGVPTHSSADDLLSSGIDCCVIAAPTSEHEQLAMLAADNGVSVLIEKPLAPSHEAARRIADRFEQAGLIGAVGHIERFNPATIALHQRLSDKVLGDRYQIATRRQGPFPERIRDVGVIMDLATHDIDTTRWVTASSYDTVDAWTSHKSGRRHEDLVIAVGQLDSGVVVSHHVNWLSPQKERVTVVTGEGGTLVADTLTADLIFFENAHMVTEWPAMAAFRGVGEGNITRYALTKREPLRSEIEAFRDAVLGEPHASVSLTEGAEVVRTAERMLESASGRSNAHGLDDKG